MKKAIKIIGNILAWILLILALVVTILVFSSNSNNGVSNLFGFMPLTVESPSMEPTIKQDDLIIVREIDDVNDLKVGDVITYRTILKGLENSGDRLNTHRIVEIVDNNGIKSFVTKGDNNPVNDEQKVASGDLVGKWNETRIPKFGAVMRFLRTKTGFFLCIILPMALFFLYELYKFIATILEIRKPKITEQDEEEIKRKAIEEYLASQKQKEAEEAAKAPAEAPAEAPPQEVTPETVSQPAAGQTADTQPEDGDTEK